MFEIITSCGLIIESAILVKLIIDRNKTKVKIKDNYFITQKDITKLQEDKKNLKEEILEKQEQFSQICANIDTQVQIEKNMEDTSRKAFASFCKILEQDYEKKSNEYDEKISECLQKWEVIKDDIAADQEKEEKELERLKSIRKAIQEANLREEEIAEQQDFYRLKITDDELSDVLLFEEFKTKVKNKRAVSMLIWSTWFQKPMTVLCNRVLGKNPVCGIYKITNLKTKQCYIGQSTSTADRFKQHAKCGLGIDTPAGNKLYAAMQKDGITNFTWELLEECSKEELNERERYYIEAYMAKDYGYNSNAGVR